MLFRRRPRNAMLWVAVTSVLLASPVIAQDSKIKAQTFVYKTVGKLEIKADVHPTSADRARRLLGLWRFARRLVYQTESASAASPSENDSGRLWFKLEPEIDRRRVSDSP